MKRVLVATDGSAGANRAVDYAAQQAKDYNADLLIVNVIGGFGILDDVFLRATEGQQVWLKELLDTRSAEILTEGRRRALGIGTGTVQLASRAGRVAETVIEIARERGADVIVVGKRGAGQVAGLLLGSISQKLVSLAELPVTVVP